jgi:hypothetical protein
LAVLSGTAEAVPFPKSVCEAVSDESRRVLMRVGVLRYMFFGAMIGEWRRNSKLSSEATRKWINERDCLITSYIRYQN